MKNIFNPTWRVWLAVFVLPFIVGCACVPEMRESTKEDSNKPAAGEVKKENR